MFNFSNAHVSKIDLDKLRWYNCIGPHVTPDIESVEPCKISEVVHMEALFEALMRMMFRRLVFLCRL